MKKFKVTYVSNTKTIEMVVEAESEDEFGVWILKTTKGLYQKLKFSMMMEELQKSKKLQVNA